MGSYYSTFSHQPSSSQTFSHILWGGFIAVFLHLCPQQFFLCKGVASVGRKMKFLCIFQRTAATATVWFFFCLLVALSMQMTASAPHTTRGLFASGTDIAIFLAVITLCKTCAGSVCIIFDNDRAEIWQFANFLRFFASFERVKE